MLALAGLGFLSAPAAAQGPPVNIVPFASTSVILSSSERAILQVFVTDAAGTPVQDPTVRWEGPVEGPRAIFYTVTPDPEDPPFEPGYAEQTVSASGGFGSYEVTATLGNGASVTFHITNLSGDPASLRILSGLDASTLIGTAFPEPLVVQVLSTDGTPLQGGIPVTATPRSSGPTIQSVAPLITDAQGIASFQLSANGVAGRHTFSLTATATPGSRATATARLSNLTVPPTTLQYVSGSGQDPAIGGPPKALQARVLGPDGLPLANVAVDFTGPTTGPGLGGILDQNGLTPPPQPGGGRILTDSSGIALAYVFANATPGSYVVTARTFGVASSASFALTNTARTVALIRPNGHAEGEYPGSEAPVGGRFDFFFEVIDTDGAPLAGAVLTLTPPASADSILLDETVIVADEEGIARGSGFATDTPGFYYLRADAEGGAHASMFMMNRPLGFSVGEQLADVAGLDHQGAQRSLRQFLEGGRYLIIDVCTGWCSVCRLAQPDSLVAKAQLESLGIPVSIVPLLLESSERGQPSTQEDALAWHDEFQLTDPVLHVSGERESALAYAAWYITGIQSPGFPTYLLVAPDRTIVRHQEGAMDAAGLKALVLDNVPSQRSLAAASVPESSRPPSSTLSRSRILVPASVAYSTAPGAASTGDFTSASGLVTFAAGQSVATVGVALTNDTTDEPDEKFTVNLSNAVGATIRRGQATVTIRDDDSPSVLSVDDLRVVEGTGGTTTAKVTIRLDRPSAFAVSVSYDTVAGTAKSTDFTAVSGKAGLKAGDATLVIGVPIVADKLAEFKETFAFRLLAADSASIGDAEGVITIVDDDLDTTAPVIASKADVVVEVKMASTSTVIVNYVPPSAKDDRDGAVPVDCLAPSGAKHGYGKEVVTCTAEDRAGNLSTRTFVLVVRLPTVSGALFDPRDRTTPLTEAERGDRILVHVNPGAFAPRARVALSFVDARGRREPMGHGRAGRDGSLDEVFELPHHIARGQGQVLAESEGAAIEYDRAWFLTVLKSERRHTRR